MVKNSCKEVVASLIGKESDKYPLVWAACSFGTLASSLDFSQTRNILDSILFMSSWSGREIIGIIAWIPKLSTLELLAAGDGSMASTITWWEESTLNRQSWEGVLVEGSAEICMCWEVSLLTEKRFCSVWLSAVLFGRFYVLSKDDWMVLPVGLSSFPEVRCSYLWHPYGLCLTQHSAFLAVVHSSLKPKNYSEAARIPQWQQAMSEELPVLRKTSFITLSDREGLKPLPDGNTTIEGNSDSLLVSILRRLLPRRQGLLLYGLWLQLLPRWESSLCSGNAFQKGKLRKAP